MLNKTKQIHNYLTKFKVYQHACVVVKTAIRVGKIYLPALVGAYLIDKYDDKLIIAIAVSGVLYSLTTAVASAWFVEKSK